MPVEIRELILRTTIVSSSMQNDVASSSDASKEEIIAACTAEVLRILKRERER